MNWQKVVEELRRRADAQSALVNDPYKHTLVKQAASTAGAVLYALADAFEKGQQP